MRNKLFVHPSLHITSDGEYPNIQLPKVIRVNNFNEHTAREFSKAMGECHNLPQPIIPIIIDSYGGNVYSLLSMIDEIEASEKQVATIAMGKAMSCGAVLLACGTKGLRFISQNATALIHDVSSFSMGKTEDNKVSVAESERLKKLIMHKMAKNAGKEKSFYIEELNRRNNTDWYLSPQSAKKYGLVDHIGVPHFQTYVDVAVQFVFGGKAYDVGE